MIGVILALLLETAPVTGSDGLITWDPPARYDHHYDGRTVITLLHPDNVPDACRNLLDGTPAAAGVTEQQKGCATIRNGVCRIIAINRVAYDITPEAVIRHERGHCNGWHWTHPE